MGRFGRAVRERPSTAGSPVEASFALVLDGATAEARRIAADCDICPCFAQTNMVGGAAQALQSGRRESNPRSRLGRTVLYR